MTSGFCVLLQCINGAKVTSAWLACEGLRRRAMALLMLLQLQSSSMFNRVSFVLFQGVYAPKLEAADIAVAHIVLC
jgi:hypothetical protein